MFSTFVGGLKTILVCLAAVLIVTKNGVQSKRSPHPYLGEVKWPTIAYDSGNLIPYENAPYAMQLRNGDGAVVCDGTLIRPQYVLTAAHCFDKYEAADITVVGGATLTSEDGVQRTIETVFKHETYDPETLHNDAAVLMLSSPMEGEAIQAYGKICEKPVKSNDFVSATGWVRSTETGRWKTEQLRTSRFPVLGQQDCLRDTPDSDMEITSSMFCGNLYSRDACLHNAGGPAITYGQVCGIVVGGSGCKDPDFPGVYISVYKVRDFVLKSIGE